MSRYTAEGATRTLQTNPDMPDGLRRYFEAVRDGTLSEYYRGEFSRLQNDYSDELPDVDVRNLIDDPERLTKYKCQGNYVVSLCLSLKGALADDVITDQGTQKVITNFLSSDLNFQVGDPVNSQRISQINTVLGSVLRKLG